MSRGLEQVERAVGVDAEVGLGSDAAQSCDGCAAVWIDEIELAVRPRIACRRRRVSDVRLDRAKLARVGLDQAIGVCWVEAYRAEEPRTHVVLETDHVVAGLDEMGDRLRADEPPDPVMIATGIASPSSRVNAISENRCPAMRNGDEGDRARIRGRHLHRESRTRIHQSSCTAPSHRTE